MTLKAIQTEYKGYLFRSKTEARYAVALDSLGEEWIYEVEGFTLDGGCYAPDFWLPHRKMYLEVKGVWPTETEIRKCRQLQFHSGHDVAICYGMPTENESILFSWSEEDGGTFTETLDPWPWKCEQAKLDQAANAARRFRYEFPNSRPYGNIVDYGDITF